jgi:sec-independent protein translocase protein TatA
VQLGPAEILVILVVALLVFGPTRLPEIGRQVGRGVRELRKFQDSIRDDLSDAFSEDHSGSAEPPPTLPPRAETTTPEADPGEADAAEVEPAEPTPPTDTP